MLEIKKQGRMWRIMGIPQLFYYEADAKQFLKNLHGPGCTCFDGCQCTMLPPDRQCEDCQYCNFFLKEKKNVTVNTEQIR